MTIYLIRKLGVWFWDGGREGVGFTQARFDFGFGMCAPRKFKTHRICPFERLFILGHVNINRDILLRSLS
jgi:hypothetical protein